MRAPRRALAMLALLALPVAAGAQGAADALWSQSYTSASPGVVSLAYAPDGQTVATGHGDSFIKLWRASDGALIRSFRHITTSYGCGAITSLSYSPDGALIAASSGACGTQLFNAADGSLVRTLNAIGHNAFSPDGRYLATSGATSYTTRFLKLWSVADGGLAWSVTGGGGGVAFSPDGQSIGTISRDGVELWRASDGAKLRTIAGPQKLIALSPDGQLVAAAGSQIGNPTSDAGGEYSYDDTIYILRVADGSLVQRIKRTSSVTCLAFTPDGQHLYAGGYDNDEEPYSGYVAQMPTIRYYRVADGAALKVFDENLGAASVSAVAPSPDGAYLAYAHDATTAVARVPSSPCVFSLDQVSVTYQRAGGLGLILVNAPAGCSWTARNRASWLTVSAGQSGTGPGVVTYSVAPYLGLTATGAPYYIYAQLVVAEQTFALRQNIIPPPEDDIMPPAPPPVYEVVPNPPGPEEMPSPGAPPDELSAPDLPPSDEAPPR